MANNIIYKAQGRLGLITLESALGLGDLVDKHLIRRRNNKNHFATESFNPDSFKINIKESRFANGEAKVKLDETVRGRDIYILCDIGNYSCTYQLYGHENLKGPDEHFQDIKRTIAAVGGKSNRTTVIMPLLYASRQHTRKGRESLDCAMALQELYHLGITDILTFDVHDPNIQNAIPLSSFENIYPTYEIVKTMLETERDFINDKESMIVIAPDTGAMDRAIYYASVLKLDVGMFYKRRDFTKIVKGKNPIVEHSYMGTDIAGKDALIVDDMIASGESVLDVARELKKRKANKIYVATAFGMFTEGLETFNKAYEEELITRVFSTNLTYISPKLENAEWHKSVDMSGYLAKIIDYLNYNKSLAPLLDSSYGINELIIKTK